MKVFHNEEARRIDFLDERFYASKKIPDTYYPSVTHVLDVFPKGYGFIQWLKDLGNNSDLVVERAAKDGSMVHDLCERYLKNEELTWDNNGNPYPLNVWLMFLKFRQFWNVFKPTLIATERTLVSDNYQIAGTADLVVKIGKEIWMIDIKTSNAIYPGYEFQLAAYSMMWNEEFPKHKIDRTGIFWAKAKTRGGDSKGKKIQGRGWQIKEFDRHYTDAFKIFQHTHALWKEVNPNPKPKNLVYPATASRVADEKEGFDFEFDDLD